MSITYLRCVPSDPRSRGRKTGSDAASMPSTLRVCFPPRAWSMRDGMSNMQADVMTMNELQVFPSEVIC
jgi:hypothetical protein